MHSHKRGKSHSTRPPTKTAPSWIRYTPEEVRALIVKLAKEGHPPSKIGLILRDVYGIPLVKLVLGKKIVEVLKEEGISPTIPEDLSNLIKKAEKIRKHLEIHKSDGISKRALQLVESKIHRLVKYYKREGVLPPDWEVERTFVFR